jgi:hypothetical protein
VRAAFLLLVTVAFAGCSGDGDKEEEPEPTAQTGCIVGVVVDAAIVPLEGANVSLPRTNASFVTLADGEFTFCELDPGLYIVQARRVDYLPMEVNAEVRAGETADAQIVLPVDPAPKPFHRTVAYHGFVNASAGFASSVVDPVADPVYDELGVDPCHCRFRFNAEGPVHTFIVEATWDDSLPSAIGPTQYYAELAAVESGNTVGNYIQDPGYWYVEGAEFDEVDRTYDVSLYADDAWPAAQQDYELFVTAFYYRKPPEGWSFIEGDS